MIDSRSERVHHSFAILERILFVVGAILLSWYLGQQVMTAFEQAKASRELESVHIAVGSPAPATATLATGALVGRIDIPRLGLSAMVREGDDVGTLRHAVGHIPETALPGQPGNAGLAGHRDTFFRALKNVRAGDRIRVTTPRGPVEYIVDGTKVVDPDDVSVLNPTPNQTLTLVTCYPFYYIGSAPRRFIVRAQLAAASRER